MKLKLAAALTAAFLPSAGHAAVTIGIDQAAFDAATAGTSFIGIDFDTIAAGTDINGVDLGGVTFNSTTGNTMEVVAASDTFTPNDPEGDNGLPPTSPDNVLSPGGTELPPGPDIRQLDSFEIIFDEAVSAVSFDVLFQSFDIATFTRVEAFSADGTRLRALQIPGSNLGGGAPSGSQFIGITSDDPMTDFIRVVITESDNNAAFPDSNIGLDTLLYSGTLPPSDPVPVPAALPLFASALFLGRRLIKRS